MKKKVFILAFCSFSLVAFAGPKKATAETAAQPETAIEEEPTITEECLRNVSLVHEHVRNKQFEEAYEPWMQLYNECPNANKSIYTNGSKIVDYFYEKAKADNNTAEMERFANIALDLCDKRIKYFGNDPKYPTAYILGEKGLEYCEHHESDPIKAEAYPWLKQSVEGLKTASKITVLRKFFEVSYAIYKSDPTQYMQNIIDDYTFVNGILMEMQADQTSKYANQAVSEKKYIDELFVSSGAASCDKLDELYAGFSENNSGYLEDLLAVLSLYKRVGCTETPVYFAISETAHKMQPTEESAVGCAKMCMKKEDWNGALEYYRQALDLSEENDEDKADYFYMMAYIYMDKLKNYTSARTYALKSLEENPNAGRCYILIGLCYASTKPYGAEMGAKAPILNKTVFWAAVDKFMKAKQIDPSCEADANQLIATYSKYFPTKEERFDLPSEFGGAYFIVGGWINEKTVIR